MALSDIRHPVPDSAFLPAIDVLSHLDNDELVHLVLTYSHTSLFRFSLETIARRGIKLPSLATRFHSLLSQDDPRLPDAVQALKAFAFIEKQDNLLNSQEIVQDKFNSRYFDQLVTGFLCDQENLFSEYIPPDQLLEKASKILLDIDEEKYSLFYFNSIQNVESLVANIPQFIPTNEAKKRLDVVIYALKAGTPLIIQGPTSASKSITVQVATQLLYQQPPLIYALCEQTEIADLRGRKNLERHDTALLSFVLGILTRT